MYKRILLILSLLLGGIGIAVFYTWKQAMQLPAWYTESSAKKNSVTVIQPAKKTPKAEEVLRKVTDNLTSKTTKEVRLDAAEINSLLVSSMNKKNKIKKFTTAIKGTKTRIQDGKISIGAVIETSSIPIQELSARKQGKIIQFIQNLPGNEKRLYIGIEGKPNIRDRKFIFDDNTKISLGNFSFPIAEFSQNLGLSPESLNRLLSQELHKLPIKLESVNIQDELVIIRGSQNNKK